MASYQTLVVDNKDGVTTVTLNRPEKRNAMSPQLHREMYDCLNDLRYDKDTRVIIITGAGDSFCAGQDLKQFFIEMDSQPARVRDEMGERQRFGGSEHRGEGGERDQADDERAQHEHRDLGGAAQARSEFGHGVAGEEETEPDVGMNQGRR